MPGRTLTPTRRAPTRRALLIGAAGVAAASVAPRRAWALDPINIANASGDLASTLTVLMEQQGYFVHFGLAAKPLFVVDGTRLLSGVVAGDIDLCPLTGFSQLFPAIEKGARIKLTDASVRLGQQLIFSANPAVRTIADLKGKTVGVGSVGAQLYQTTVALLLKNGVDPASVKFANVGSSGDVYRAIVAKVVDAGPSQIDDIPEAKKDGVHEVKGGEMWSDLAEYPFQGGFASDKAIAGKRELLVRALAAYAMAFRFLSGPDSQDAFRAARRAALSKSGAAFDAASDFQWQFLQKIQPFALDLLLPPQGVDFVQDLNVRLGIQEKKLPYDQVADMSLAKEAVKLL